jgi:hypothetical protein
MDLFPINFRWLHSGCLIGILLVKLIYERSFFSVAHPKQVEGSGFTVQG